MKLLLLTTGLALSMPLFAFGNHASVQLNQTLQHATNQTLQANQALGATAIEVSVLLPDETTPRDFVAGTQATGKDARKATTYMMVQYGSITKAYTATLLLNEIKQNKHAFPQGLNTQLGRLTALQPEFQSGQWPARWKSVTVAELLNMTSGIPASVNNFKVLASINPYAHYSPDQLIAMGAHYEQTTPACAQAHDTNAGCFAPGSQYFYSNTNYIIAGLLVQRYADKHSEAENTFAHIMNTAVLRPVLGPHTQTCVAGPKHLNALCYDTHTPSAKMRRHMIHGYYHNVFSGPYLKPGMDMIKTNLSSSNSAGALTGTTDGLARLTRALFTNVFHSQAALTHSRYMVVQTAPGQPVQHVHAIQTSCTGTTYCYGLGVTPAYHPILGTVWTYGGKTFGFGTEYIWIPRENVVIIFSMNTSVSQYKTDALLVPVVNAINYYLGYPTISHW